MTTSDTYQRIIQSAKELIHSKSYADVGWAAICEKADVNKGSFYHFFPSKQELTLAVMDDYFADFKDDILDEAFSPRIAPLQRFEHFVDLSVAMQEHMHKQTGQVYGCPFGNLAIEISTQDETLRQKLERVFHKFQQFIREALEEAVERGELAPVDIEKTSSAFLAYFEGCMLLAKTRNQPELLRQLLPAVLQIRL